MPNPDALHGPEVRRIGKIVAFRPTVTSTNDVAKQLARSGAPEGSVFVTDYQTEGRGRRDRKWLAPPGGSLLFSVLFRPSLAPDAVQLLTMLCGLSVVDAVQEVVGRPARLKWPNDILLGGAKVGGILTEVDLSEKGVEYAVVGIGLNVNVGMDDLASPLLMAATSLLQVARRRVSRWELLEALLSSIEERYSALRRGVSPQAEWTQRLAYMGEMVTVSEAGGRFEGIAVGVDTDGALLVRLGDGRKRRVLAGDVSVRRAGTA